MENLIKETLERKKAVESAIASLEMEGFVFTEDELKQFQKYIKGEIPMEDIIADCKAYVEDLRKKSPDKFVKGI